MAVTQLLERHFGKLVDYQFTARMEQTLDDVASGDAERQPYLEQFYLGVDGLEQQVQTNEDQIDPREACTIQLKGLSTGVRVGKYGPFLSVDRDGKSVSVSLPNDIAPADLTDVMAQELIERKAVGPQALGIHPEENRAIYKKIGPYGPYLQLGEDNNAKDDPKPKRVSLPKGVSIDSIDLDAALKYLTLPRTLGNHPTSGAAITASIGPYGPYVACQKVFKSIPKTGDVLTIDLDAAVELLSQAKVRKGATPIRELGNHPEDGEPIGLYEGRYGPYVKHGDTIASIPKDTAIESVTLEAALPWIAEKASAPKKPGRKKSATRKTAVKKKAATKKKAASKKAAE
jgi:DNA topoisomerase-1